MNAVADKLIADINGKYGAGAAHYAKDMPPIEYVNSGSLTLNFAIGTGGVPANRVIEIFGSEGAGKTTLALLMASEKLDLEPDRLCLFLDMEHKLTPAWMETLVGPERMERIVVMNPDTIEQCSEMYRQAVSKGVVTCTILDSIGGAPTNQVMDLGRSAEQAGSPGGNAKGVSDFAKFAMNLSAKYNCLTIGINQVRDKMNAMRAGVLITPGGHQWKHACVLRIQLKREYDSDVIEKINGEKVVVGFGVQAQIVKNHVAGSEGRVATWKFYSRPNSIAPVGIDTVDECLKLSEITGVIKRGGSYYSHPAFPADAQGKNRFNGKDAMIQAIREDAALRGTIVSEVMAALSGDDVDLSEIAPIQPIGEEEEAGGTGMAVVGKRVRAEEQ